jgi:NAD-dependent SIR2 family protein deacetylase
VQHSDLEALGELVRFGGISVLSGAGLSTESGIPDYRGETGRKRPATPMTYQEFTGSSAARQRYWARSHLGWRVIGSVHPNDGHRAVAELQQQGLLTGIVTQNVDGLHQAAGAQDVVELHGALDRVTCLGCGTLSRRTELEVRLSAANPGWERENLPLKPDGDVDLDDTSAFVVADCVRCGGLLKPDVVFFGETVPRDLVARAFQLVDASRALLVLGSSLTVMSGYRFVLHAKRHGKPVALVNQGPTRADAHADLKVEARLGEVLPALSATMVA